MDITEEIKKWKDRKGKLKEKFSYLTDSDLIFQEGKYNDMLIRLQIKLGKPKGELQAILEAL